jgi:signal transduction histidine kinase
VLDTTLQPAQTAGNPRLVERLVANLVSNAIHHNVDGGSIELATATRDGHAVLTVVNTGPTIPASELERIFQPFQRLDRARTNDGHGLGLGLSIVQAIADAHEATITTRAPADGGLHIEVSFPA